MTKSVTRDINSVQSQTAKGTVHNGRRLQLFCPRKGVVQMQYVTYENLFAFSLVIIGILGLALSFLEHKKK